MLEQHLELPHLLLPLRLLLVLLRSDLLLLRAVPVPAASCQLYAMPRAGVHSLLHTLCRADFHSMPNAVVPTALRAMHQRGRWAPRWSFHQYEVVCCSWVDHSPKDE